MRFPEFSGEWDITTIGEISNIKNGPFGSVLHAEDYVSDGIPIVTTEHFKSGSLPIVKDGIPQVSEQDYIRLKGYKLQTNDIVFSRVGSVDINAYVSDTQNGWLFSGRVLRVRPISSVNSLCLHFVLSTEKVKQSIRSRAVGQTMPSINTPILSITNIFLPKSLEEQRKISIFLALIDARLETQKKIIEDLKKLKDAITHSHYKNELSHSPMAYIGQYITQVSKRNKDAKIDRVLSVSNKYGFINQDEQFEDREVASADTSNYKVVHKGDFAYNPARINVGSVARLKDFENGIVSPMYVCFKTNKELLPAYFELYLSTNIFKHEMTKRLEGSVRLCLTYESLCNIKIALPEINAQKDFVSKVSTILTKIKAEERLLLMYHNCKQYLLAQMFI